MPTSGRLSIKGYGSRRVDVIRIVHGMSVFSWLNQEDASRTRKTFLTFKRTSGSFDCDIIFTAYEAWEDFSQWLESYIRLNTDPDLPTNPVRLTVPSRDFDKTGSLEGTVTYGDEVAAPSWVTSLQFMGSRDPLDLDMKELTSSFILPESNDPALPRMYPAGTQLTERIGRQREAADEYDIDFGLHHRLNRNG